jgi:hypothetical protein
LKTTSFDFQKLVPWRDYIEKVRKYKFALEPHGRCYNGYRLYESIILGVIPIVFSSPINELYEDLPILVIDSFEQLNPEFLVNKYIEISSRNDYKLEKLRMTYWTNMMDNDLNTTLT